jgi:hypothetical protein
MDIFTLQQVMRYKQDPTKAGANNGTMFYGKHAAVYHSFARGDGWQTSTNFNSNFNSAAQTQGMLGNILGAYSPSAGDTTTRLATTSNMGYKQQNVSRLLYMNGNSSSRRTKIVINDFMGHQTSGDWMPYNALFFAIRNETQTTLTPSLSVSLLGYTTNTNWAMGTLVPNNSDNDLVTDCTFTQLANGTAVTNLTPVISLQPEKTTILWFMFPWVYVYGQYIAGYHSYASISGFDSILQYPQLAPDHEVTCAIMNKIGARGLDPTDTTSFAPLWNKASQHQRIVGMY